MREKLQFTLSEKQFEKFSEQLLLYSCSTKDVAVFNSNTSASVNISELDLIAGVGSISSIHTDAGQGSFDRLKSMHDTKPDWLFGYFSYDLKNELEKLNSNNFDGIQFPDIYFFQPRYVFLLKGNCLTIEYLPELDSAKSVDGVFNDIFLAQPFFADEQVSMKPRMSKSEYLNSVHKIQDHIQRGDIYEMNFCQEFFDDDAKTDPVQTHLQLNEISQTPFSAFYKLDQKYLMCASPERFLKKTGARIISQPIKGTVKRGNTPDEDELLKRELFTSDKERNENVMIVDLVRNDLSRIAEKGTVKVDELYGIYTFNQVHQMISTVSCELRADIHWVDAIRNTFPMGSMTGAPKVKAMELAEKYESTQRGLYSGAVGYVTPAGDFDFNVVIRSILYNKTSRYLSFMVGSAITAKSNAEKEYDECLLKAKAMFQVLENKKVKVE